MKYYTWSEDWNKDVVVEYDSVEILLKQLKEYHNHDSDIKIIVGEEMSAEEFIRRNEKC